MSRRRRRRRRIRLTAQGYKALGLLALVIALAFGVRVLFVLFKTKHPAEVDAADVKATASPVETAAPESGVALPEITTASAVITPAPTPTMELASTGSRLPTEEERAGAVEGIIRTSAVALRKGPGKNYDKIYKYDVGERLLVFAEEDGYTFVQVLSDQRYGFLSSDFVVKFGLLPGDGAAATPVPAPPAGCVMGLVNVEELSLRKQPSKDNNKPFGVANKGALLWVHCKTGEFYYVDVVATGEKAYVYAEYVMVQADPPSGTPGPIA